MSSNQEKTIRERADSIISADNQSGQESTKMTNEAIPHPKSASTHPELKGTMSTRERKRILQEQRWNAKKEIRKDRRKEERKRLAERRKNGLALPRVSRAKMERCISIVDSGVTIVLDMGFDSYMIDKEIRSTAGQVVYSYSCLKPSKEFYFKVAEKLSVTEAATEEEGQNVCLSSDDQGQDDDSALEKKFEFKTCALKLVRMSESFKELLTKTCPGHVNWQNVSYSSLPLHEEYSKLDYNEVIEFNTENETDESLDQLYAINGVKRIPKPKQNLKSSRGSVKKPDSSSKNTASEETSSLPTSTQLDENKGIRLSSNFSRCVYLTADSPNVLERLEPGTHYFLGGIVDRNRHKNLCLKEAEALGMQTARLPIGSFLDLKTRHVLTINQVVAIMMSFLNNNDWKQSFLDIIPERKGGKERTPDELDNDDPASDNGSSGIETVPPEKKRKTDE